jgi:hypothetical protein
MRSQPGHQSQALQVDGRCQRSAVRDQTAQEHHSPVADYASGLLEFFEHQKPWQDLRGGLSGENSRKDLFLWVSFLKTSDQALVKILIVKNRAENLNIRAIYINEIIQCCQILTSSVQAKFPMCFEFSVPCLTLRILTGS